MLGISTAASPRSPHHARQVRRMFTLCSWPSRRLPHLVGIVPGTRRRAGRPGILAVIDTSASLTSELLGQISGELGRLAADYRVTVVECDDEIQSVYSYRPIHSVEGRGGTHLRPPFEPAFLQRYRPDLIVYFTDGEGPSPEKPPRQPVVWCLTPDGERPAEWGEWSYKCARQRAQKSRPPCGKSQPLHQKSQPLHQKGRNGDGNRRAPDGIRLENSVPIAAFLDRGRGFLVLKCVFFAPDGSIFGRKDGFCLSFGSLLTHGHRPCDPEGLCRSGASLQTY